MRDHRDVPRFPRRTLLAALALAIGCGNTGANQVKTELSRGQRTTVELTVTASAIVAGELLSCDFVSVRPRDPDNQLATQNMDVDLTDSGKSSSVTCTARVGLAAHVDAVPGDYHLDLDFDYTYTDSNDVLTGQDQGRIKVTILP